MTKSTLFNLMIIFSSENISKQEMIVIGSCYEVAQTKLYNSSFQWKIDIGQSSTNWFSSVKWNVLVTPKDWHCVAFKFSWNSEQEYDMGYGVGISTFT